MDSDGRVDTRIQACPVDGTSNPKNLLDIFSLLSLISFSAAGFYIARSPNSVPGFRCFDFQF